MVRAALQQEAWRVLEGDSAILDVARDVSRILREERIRGAIVGGVAVGLHGHVRATADVDVYVPDPLPPFADAMRRNGYAYDEKKREFSRGGRGGVPVHIVTDEQTGGPPARLSRIDEITTVSLADLVTMKLRSGTGSMLRAQDLADVIALIRAHKLTGKFSARIAPGLRAEFRKLVRAVEAEKP